MYKIINNNSPEDFGVITVWYGKYQLNNKNTLFFTQYGKLEIYNCKINLLK